MKKGSQGLNHFIYNEEKLLVGLDRIYQMIFSSLIIF